MPTAFNEDDVVGVYAAAYTPQAALAAATVLPQSFSLVSQSGAVAKISEAYYYPEANRVKLVATAKAGAARESWQLSSTGVTDTEGATANAAARVYLFGELPIAYGETAVSSFTLLKNGVPVKSAVGQSGLVAAVRICNATGTAQSGYVRIYDGDTQVSAQAFSVQNEGFCEITADVSGHTFANEPCAVLTGE